MICDCPTALALFLNTLALDWVSATPRGFTDVFTGSKMFLNELLIKVLLKIMTFSYSLLLAQSIVSNMLKIMVNFISVKF